MYKYVVYGSEAEGDAELATVATLVIRCARCAWLQWIETSAIAHGDGIYISLRRLNPEGVT